MHNCKDNCIQEESLSAFVQYVLDDWTWEVNVSANKIMKFSWFVWILSINIDK